MEAAHDLNVKRLQGVASRLDEEDAGMDAVIDNVHTIDFVLGIQVGIKALLNVVNDRPPRLIVVDKVTKSWGVDNGQSKANTGLLNIGTDGLNSNGLGDDIGARTLALLGWVQRGVEESVDESRLSQSRFT